MTSETFFMGLDGGGTRCRARLEDAAGNLLGLGESGAANIMRDFSIATASILDACTQAIAASKRNIALSDVVVGAGLAGANIPLARDRYTSWQHPFAESYVLSDLHAACLGAHDGHEGAMIVCGTGSAATCYVDGIFLDTGGHGFLLGDMASGAWLGHKAVQHTLLCLDGLQPVDAVSNIVCERLGVSDDLALVTQVSDFSAANYATLAPSLAALCDNNDPVACAFFGEGGAYLQQVAAHLLATKPLPLCLTGGLAPRYKRYFSTDIQSRIVAARLSPEQGALLHAKSQHHLSSTGGKP